MVLEGGCFACSSQNHFPHDMHYIFVMTFPYLRQVVTERREDHAVETVRLEAGRDSSIVVA
jgi:hypothetical protein